MNETLSIATLLAMLGFNAISRAEAVTEPPKPATEERLKTGHSR
jgi:hypothetical protein